MPSNDKAPTIRAIADKAGVSVASVSRVLNDDVRVSARTRARIEMAIYETGYI
ncbi:MAG: LacI family DNA-binding transcriptional regulator, partial [Nocardioidaceae bacterium]